MKLKDGFLTHSIGEETVLVPVGAAASELHGLVRLNETAAFIVQCLAKDCTEEEITERMLAEYAADKEVLARDVRKVLDQLRSFGAIEE